MIEGSDLSVRLERRIKNGPLKAASHLADLDDLLKRKPDLDYERSVRDGLLAAFDRLGRCSHCGRELWNTLSVSKGVGPACAKRLREAERRRQEAA